jgi:uncharacterized damage-inducible protein DinB
MLARHFLTMAFNNAWANHRLLKAVLELSPDEFRLERVSFFPSIKSTLNHLVTVDWFYVDALERSLRGEPLNPQGRDCFDPEEPFDDPPSLAKAQRLVDRRLIDFCASLADDRLGTIVHVPWKIAGSERTDRVLSHLFQHQIHHRGQAHAMLAGTRVPPPQLDEFFCAGDAPLRATDFAELGFSEDEIFSPKLSPKSDRRS